MAQVTYVKAAQQRYETVPVIDPETGEQKRTPVMNSDGSPKKTKRGALVFRDVTARSSVPLPNHVCGKCGQEIKVGDPYKWIAPRSGPYGGRKLYRCGTCPVWNVWEYSSSLSARLAEVGFNFHEAVQSAESEDDVQTALDDAGTAVREIAEEKREAAQNIEDGFQHETYQSQELNDTADSLESWADEIEGATIPDFPEPEETECDECDGGGEVDNPEYDGLNARAEELDGWIEGYLESLTWPGRQLSYLALYYRWLAATRALAWVNEQLTEVETQIECEECSGIGQVTPDEPTDEQVQEWRDEVDSDVTIVDEPPV